MTKIAIIFDDRTRPETTGVYCRRALASLADVVFFHPDDLAGVPRTGFDLYLVIDDGHGYPLRADLHPLVYWAIDTHIGFERSARRAGQADCVFAAQRDGAERLRQAGIDTARWLPLACDAEMHGQAVIGHSSMVIGKEDAGAVDTGRPPTTHHSQLNIGERSEEIGGSSQNQADSLPAEAVTIPRLTKVYEICFVGNLFPGPRSDLVRLLRMYYPEMFVGNAYFQDMARIYSASKIVFNRSVLNDLNMRVFEALASGSLLITNELNDAGRSWESGTPQRAFPTVVGTPMIVQGRGSDPGGNGQGELFRDGNHLVTYRTSEELLEKVRYYLEHDEERERIAAAGREEVLAKHTYRQRMEEMLGQVIGHSSLVIGKRPEAASTVDISLREMKPHAERNAYDCQGPMTKDQAQLTNDHGPLTPHPSQLTFSYYDFPRPDVLALVPPTARRVLDVGCGTGRLGQGLKARQSCEVVGIEQNEQAAAVARTRLDVVHVGDFERLELQFPDGHFDAVVFADVLEHLLDPVAQLARVRPWLRPGDGLGNGGVVVASIPNARHADVVRSLLEGNWTYQASGPLDNTHTGFYTRRNIEELFEAAGYSAVSWTAVPGQGYDEWVANGSPGEIDLGRLQLVGFPQHDAQEFFVYQWLVVAKVIGPLSVVIGDEVASAASVGNAVAGVPTSAVVASSTPPLFPASPPFAPPSPAMTPRNATEATEGVPCRSSDLPPCLLLMVTYNRLAHTKVALDSVLALDYPRLRIVVFDNASTDGSLEYLRERLRGEQRATLLASNVNRGVVYPMNLVWFGDQASRPAAQVPRREPPVGTPSGAPHWASGEPPVELLAKVDNDTWVPPDLLLRLAECHQRSERFGALSGFHFRAEGEALVEEGRAGKFDGVRVLAQPYVGGCAVMVRRAVLDRLGPICCRGDLACSGDVARGSDAPNGDGRGTAPVLDSGWTFYQERMTELGLVNGYPWPPIHVDHMEDVRSPRSIRTAEHEAYKQAMRGMSLEEFTRELCVWRPIWEGIGDRGQVTVGHGDSAQREGNGQTLPSSPDPLIPSPSSPFPSPFPSPPSPVTPSERPMPSAQRLFFRQDFRRDFEQFDFSGPPFAFARFADGERAICMGQAVEGADGWRYAGGASPFQEALLAALRFNDRDYYIGISDGCCDAAAKEWYLRQITLPLSHVTFSNIFVNGNYERFKRLDLSAAATVAPEGADYWVPQDVVGSNFDIDQLVARLLAVKRTILVSAGPASAIIIHRYWQYAPPERRQAIVDVGSAIDEWTKGRRTRQYQVPGSRNADLVCTW